jgi:hypothetical protein
MIYEIVVIVLTIYAKAVSKIIKKYMFVQNAKIYLALLVSKMILNVCVMEKL